MLFFIFRQSDTVVFSHISYWNVHYTQERDSVREVSVIDSLEHKINELRKKLTEIVQIKGGFADEEVIRISQQLDTYIVQMQSRQEKRKNQ
ncbi:aspartyl-phosphate phosphatase Spo0E family protein [Paenibacillus sp. KS1]|uniref:aspartyl-phosphate phosphatase Spo0E family protein n=1 Tax=Paenibacillus sp. KS1 TaxID=1849249 RepID=UPI0020C7A115|nr:aspartyl-phosphate phosphatase Spo0E family protein [Paenibacillus sp. KS1]